METSSDNLTLKKDGRVNVSIGSAGSISIALMVLSLLVYGVSAETQVMAKQQGGNTEAKSSNDIKSGTDSKGESVNPPSQKDVKSRGLFSKKKKKRSKGGSAHTESQEERNLHTDDSRTPCR